MPDNALYQQEHLRHFIAPIVPRVMLCVAVIFLGTAAAHFINLVPSSDSAAWVLAVGGILSVMLSYLTLRTAIQGQVNPSGYLCVGFLLVACSCMAAETYFNGQSILHAWPYSVLASVGASFFWLRRHHFMLSLVAAFGPTFVLMVMRAYPRQEWSFAVQLIVTAIIASTAIHLLTARTNLRRFALNAELMRRASYDGLTQVLNRAAWWERAELTLLEAYDNEIPCACLFIDLDRFKQVNDSHGHSVGDDLLGEVAASLMRTTPKESLVGRLGGDEFVILLPDVGSAEARNIAGSIQAEMLAIDHPLSAMAASVGIATAHPHESLKDLVERADIAMIHVKVERQRLTLPFHLDVRDGHDTSFAGATSA